VGGSARETWNERYRERGNDPGPPAPPSDWLVRNRALFARAAAALAPGGVLIAETVTRAHVEQLGRTFNSRFLLEPGELRDSA
jgi:hypothetical protein